MASKSKYSRLQISRDDSSSSTLDVVMKRKRKVTRHLPIEAESSSSTLDGASRIRTRTRTRKRNHSPTSTTIEAIIDMYGERPLPPVPRTPSSIYASSKRNTALPSDSPVSPLSPGVFSPPPSPADLSPISIQRVCVTGEDLKSTKHLSQLFKKERKTNSNKSIALPKRRKPIQDTAIPNITAEKASPVKPIPFTEWNPPTYQEASSSSKSSLSTPLSKRSVSFQSARQSPGTENTANARAGRYIAVIHHAESTNFEKQPWPPLTPAESPTLSSTTSKDMSKQHSVPPALITNSLPRSPPRSRFSPSSPKTSDFDNSAWVTSSLRIRAKKVLLQSKTLKRGGLRLRMDSSQSDISNSSTNPKPQTSILDPSVRGPLTRNSMQRGISDMYEALENSCTLLRPRSVKQKDLNFPRSDQLSLPKKILPTKEVRSPAVPLTEYQKHGRKVWEEPKKQPYAYRLPRKRLSKPQLQVVSTRTTMNSLMTPITTTKSPDTTYKIEMPIPPTPQRPQSNLILDHTYHIEVPPIATLPLMLPNPSNTIAARSSTIKSHRLSYSSTGSNLGHRPPKRLSKAEKKHIRRYSLPTTPHRRQNPNNKPELEVLWQATGPISGSKKVGKSFGQMLVGSIPMLGLVRREAEMETVLALDAGRGRGKERADSTAKLTIAERREDLKRKIVFMGEASAIGVPF